MLDTHILACLGFKIIKRAALEHDEYTARRELVAAAYDHEPETFGVCPRLLGFTEERLRLHSVIDTPLERACATLQALGARPDGTLGWLMDILRLDHDEVLSLVCNGDICHTITAKTIALRLRAMPTRE